MAQQGQRNARPFLPWLYDIVLWFCALSIDIFFREIQPRGAWRVPKKGPLIIVAGPHANQFVDSIILMHVLRAHVHRRISFLIAEKSMNEPYIGSFAKAFGALPVARAMDLVKPAMGKIYLPDPDGQPLLVAGHGTNFKDSSFMVGGTIVFPQVAKQSPASATISEIISSNELKLKALPELHEELRQMMIDSNGRAPDGVTFKLAPHLDQSRVFNAAAEHLLRGGCIGIFPEGGSHDRLEMLPLKAGVSIMALTALAKDPDSGLSIVPCGMNYFHAHKFRSRAVLEFGPPIDVHPDQITAFKQGGLARRNAIGSLLKTINEGLTSVTQASPDYETMMLVQATRRLYVPVGKKLPLPAVVELNRRLTKGYRKFQDDQRVANLKRAVLSYDRRLKALAIKDHQLEWGDIENRPWWLTFATLLYRAGELFILAIGTLPGLVLFWPVFVTAKVISVRKREKALAGSVVKVRAHDVVSTWKLLVSAGMAPALYIWYAAVTTLWLHYCRLEGEYTKMVPSWLHINTVIPDFVPLRLVFVIIFVCMVFATFAALRTGEIGMDIVKSLPPLLVALNPFSSRSLTRLRDHRQDLAAQVSALIETLGPEILEDFDQSRIVNDLYREGAYQSNMMKVSPVEPDASIESKDPPLSTGASLDLSSAFTFRTPAPSAEQTAMTKSIRDAMQVRGRARSKTFDEQQEAWNRSIEVGQSNEDEDKKRR